MTTSTGLSSVSISGPVLCFGELLVRLSTTGQRLLSQSHRLDLHIGGAEANVAVGLARLGHDARMVSALPDNELGNLAMTALKSQGVDTSGIARGRGRMGLYFLETGGSLRPSNVIYDRAGSAFAEAAPGSFDWPRLLGGAGLLHISGVTPALGPASSEAVLHAVDAARAAGVRVSFDCNFRPSLWERWTNRPRETLAAVVGKADIVFGNHRDAALLLDREFGGEGEDRRRESADALFSAFPNLDVIASTARHIDRVDSHRLSARIDTPRSSFEADEIEISGIVDRIGAGDAFVAGILHGLLLGMDGMATAQTGLAMACLKHSLPGDAPLFTRGDLERFAQGSLDVRR